MQSFRAFALWLVFVLVFTALPMVGESETPYLTSDDGLYDVDVFLVSGNNLSTTPSLSATLPLSAGVDFNITLRGDLLVKAELIDAGKIGINITIFNIRSTSTSEETLTATIFDDTHKVAEGEESVTTLTPELTLNMEFETDTEYLFEEGHDLIVHLEGNVIAGGAQGIGMMTLNTNPVSSIAHRALNSRGQEKVQFPVYDWPRREINFTGTVFNAFGPDDIESVLVKVEKDGTAVFSDTASMSDLEYWHIWSFSTQIPGSFTYNITVTDIQENKYYVEGAFTLVDDGIALTSPDQSPEGNGTVMGEITSNSNDEYEVYVRNLGTSSVTVNLALTGPDASHAAIQLGNTTITKVEDISSGGFVEISIKVSGGGLPTGTVLSFSLEATGGTVQDQMDFEITLVALLGVSLTTPVEIVYVYTGEIAFYNITIKNLSPEVSDIFNLTYSMSDLGGWDVDIPSETDYLLGSGGETVFQINVTAPSSLPTPTEPYEIIITATSETDDTIFTSITLRTIGTEGVSLELKDSDDLDLSPDVEGTVRVDAKNEHDEIATFVFTLNKPSGWNDDFPDGFTFLFSPFEVRTLDIIFEPTHATPAGTYNFVLTAQKQGDNSISVTLDLRVTISQDKLFSLDSAKKQYVGNVAGDGSVVKMTVQVGNQGNVLLNATLDVQVYEEDPDSSDHLGDLMDWDVEYYDDDGKKIFGGIEPPLQSSVPVEIRITIPRDARPGHYRVLLGVNESSGTAIGVEGYDNAAPVLLLDVEAPFGEMASVAVKEIWLQLLLLVGVIILAGLVAQKAKA